MSIGRYQGRGLSFSTSLGLGPEYDHDHFKSHCIRHGLEVPGC